jgi:hypothetical protein
METILPLIVIGLGSAALLILRIGQLVLGGLLLQWAGLIVVTLMMGGVAPGVLAAEGIAALVCVGILSMTLTNLRYGSSPGTRLRVRQGSSVPGSADDLWPLVVAVGAAIAGLVLARLYPLGGSEGLMVAFYWTVLAGMLVLVLEGARDPVKLAAGLLALLNAAALLLSTLPGAASDPIALGLMSVCRIALAAILAYAWVVVHTLYSELSFSPLFSARDSAPATDPVEDGGGAAGVGPEEGASVDGEPEPDENNEGQSAITPIEAAREDEEWLKHP